MTGQRLRVVLMAHDEEPLHAGAVADWLAEREDLRGIIRIVDPPRARRRRVRRELKRSGVVGFMDVVAWRLYHRLRFGAESRRVRARLLEGLRPAAGSAASGSAPTLRTSGPSSPEVQAFLEHADADIMIALVKHILKPAVFMMPRHGTFVFHPGICPEYRNAHGCFWALARGDRNRVGMTVLRIDEGVDTGPVFGYFTLPEARWSSSPIALQHQVVLENLGAITDLLRDVVAGRAAPVDVADRESGTWGQPRLTAWLRRPTAAPAPQARVAGG